MLYWIVTKKEYDAEPFTMPTMPTHYYLSGIFAWKKHHTFKVDRLTLVKSPIEEKGTHLGKE